MGVSKQAVSKLVRRGYFNTREVAGRILVPRSEVEALGARHKGRPRKEASGKKKTAAKSASITKKEGLDEYISQTEAANIRGVTRQAIADLIQRGRLTSVCLVGRMLLLRSEVEAFVPQPRTGRPPKKRTPAKTAQKKKSKK
jgi:hypothetical protein